MRSSRTASKIATDHTVRVCLLSILRHRLMLLFVIPAIGNKEHKHRGNLFNIYALVAHLWLTP